MKKYLITLLVTTTILSSTAFVAKANTGNISNATNVNVSRVIPVDKSFIISTSNIDENGNTNLKVSFDHEEYNFVLVIYDNGKEISRTKLIRPSKEFNVPIKLNEYGSHEIVAQIGLTQGSIFDASTQSNEIKLGYFNHKLKESIALSYIDLSRDNFDFNVILPRVEYNCFVFVYDNDNLLYSTKLVKPTDKITFNSSLLGNGKHDIKAYVGLTQGRYFEPSMTSNSVTIFN